MYMLCIDVGPMHLTDFSKTRKRPRLEVGPTVAARPAALAGGSPAGEAERVLRRVEWNLTALTRKVPMKEIKDLRLSM